MWKKACVCAIMAALLPQAASAAYGDVISNVPVPQVSTAASAPVTTAPAPAAAGKAAATVPVAKAPAAVTPVKPAVPAAANQAPVHPVPANPAPVNPAPVHPVPANPAPVNPAPAVPKPITPAPAVTAKPAVPAAPKPGLIPEAKPATTTVTKPAVTLPAAPAATPKVTAPAVSAQAPVKAAPPAAVNKSATVTRPGAAKPATPTAPAAVTVKPPVKAALPAVKPAVTVPRHSAKKPSREKKQTATAYKAVYEVGDSGWKVREAQRKLRLLGYNVENHEGYFTKEMARELKKFQKHANLKRTGKLDEATYEALGWSVFDKTGIQKIKARDILSTAARYKGVPYYFGGTTPRGFDCSGYVQYVFRQRGAQLTRTADTQFLEGVSLRKSQLKPGDLVFFSTYEPGASHVGIYAGEGQFWNATSSRGVMLCQLNDSYWGPRYYGARRVLATNGPAAVK